MARCGCGSECTCVIQAHPDCDAVSVTGSGTPANPYRICVYPNEKIEFHHPNDLTVVKSDKYPVIVGGLLRILWELTVAPATSVTVQMWKNGATFGAPIVFTTDSDDIETGLAYAPGDKMNLEITDTGTGGAEGMVAVGVLHG